MPTVETAVEIAQPPEVITEAFLDPDNAVYWTKDLERFEVISREPGLVGSVAHLHYIQNDKRYILEDVMKEYIPNEYFKSEVTGGGLRAQVETWLREKNGNTEVMIKWSGSGNTLMMRILLPFLRGVMRRQMRSELECFKSLVEDRGAHFAR
jgi:hypothetical protein